MDEELTMAPASLRQIRDRALRLRGCEGQVTKDFEADACGKSSTCLIEGEEGEFAGGSVYVWEACAYHAHRYGRGNVVPLAVVLEALNGFDRV